MIHFSMPGWVSSILAQPLQLKAYTPDMLQALKAQLSRFRHPNPLVSVVIPAWNEENGILHTLHSLARTTTQYDVELLVIDNNSTDGTAALLDTLGVQHYLETKQGVGNARTCGLHRAKGKYILTGDSDTLYPPGWITAMTQALEQPGLPPVYCVHGTYSFLPSNNSPRWQYACYELLSSLVIRRKEKQQPYLNTLGFNTGFVREKGIEVNGYDIETQRTFRGQAGVLETNATEDGMMALRLQQAGGRNVGAFETAARVWTSDRRIQLDGGIRKAMALRLKKYLFR